MMAERAWPSSTVKSKRVGLRSSRRRISGADLFQAVKAASTSRSPLTITISSGATRSSTSRIQALSLAPVLTPRDSFSPVLGSAALAPLSLAGERRRTWSFKPSIALIDPKRFVFTLVDGV